MHRQGVHDAAVVARYYEEIVEANPVLRTLVPLQLYQSSRAVERLFGCKDNAAIA